MNDLSEIMAPEEWWMALQSRTFSHMNELWVSTEDRYEGVAWMDRAEVEQKWGIKLGKYEAETQAYVVAKRMYMLACGDDPRRVRPYLDYIARQDQSDVYGGVFFVLYVIEHAILEYYPAALDRLEHVLSIQRGDPNLGRLKIVLNDLIKGTSRYRDIAEHLKGKICAVPFKHLETTFLGNVYLCCSGWLSRSVGNVMQAPQLEHVFNGDRAQQIRKSIIDGNYRYCNWLSCPKINGADLNETLAIDHVPAVPKPLDLYLSHDYTCNLSCPSCRTQVYSIGEVQRRQYDEIYIGKLKPFFEGAQVIKLTGSGDPFASKHFRQLIKNLGSTRRNLYLHTNALLFTPKTFEDLALKGRIIGCEVSIDAATEETYRIVRRGGDFSTLLENLEFLAELRRSGEIPFFQFDFVVQRLNYREMPAFVTLARRFAVDKIFFSAIRNWNTFSPAEFVQHNVCAIGHPEFPQLAEVLKHEAMSDPIVDIGSLAFLRDVDSGNRQHTSSGSNGA